MTREKEMRIILNGKEKEIEDNTTLKDLISCLELNVDTIVIELNREIIDKEKINNVCLKDKDDLEFITFLGGG